MGSAHRLRGFTLVELLIVVVILAILAAVVIPSFQDMSDESRRAAFASELAILAEAAERYHVKTEEHLPDTSSGVWPPEWDGYIGQREFEGGTPLGGVWDTELDSFGVTAAVGAHFDDGLPDDADLLAIDEMMDDGDLTTGTLRRLAGDRYYYVLAE